MIGLSNLFGKKKALRYTPAEEKIFAASYTIGSTVVVAGVIGIIFIFMWACGVIVHKEGSPDVSIYAFLGADLLVGAAAAAAGGLFGFIFGIPRTLDPVTRAAVVTAARQSDLVAASHVGMAANTNLERISDWLTTLLIGATLVQIKDIARWVGSLGKNLISTGPAANDAVVPIIVIYFFALSFLGVYLITRLYLTSALGVLAGGDQPAPAPGLGELNQKLDAAIKLGMPRTPRTRWQLTTIRIYRTLRVKTRSYVARSCGSWPNKSPTGKGQAARVSVCGMS